MKRPKSLVSWLIVLFSCSEGEPPFVNHFQYLEGQFVIAESKYTNVIYRANIYSSYDLNFDKSTGHQISASTTQDSVMLIDIFGPDQGPFKIKFFDQSNFKVIEFPTNASKYFGEGRVYGADSLVLEHGNFRSSCCYDGYRYILRRKK